MRVLTAGAKTIKILQKILPQKTTVLRDLDQILQAGSLGEIQNRHLSVLLAFLVSASQDSNAVETLFVLKQRFHVKSYPLRPC